MSLESLFQYIDTHEPEFVKEFQKFLQQPSIAAQNVGMQECADLTRQILENAGINVTIIPTKGFPVVFGELTSKSSAKTILVYGHYDVQPPEPLDEWKYPPFSATIEDETDRIYARGATDDKGNLLTAVYAAKAFLAVTNDVPVNLKYLIEGEEEIGSLNLPQFINENKKLLKADACLSIDDVIHPSGHPAIDCGVKGNCSIQMDVRTAKIDSHSMHAPLVPSAAWHLNRALNTFKNENEEILIEGFYDDVIGPTPEELELLKAIPFDEEEYKQRFGIKKIIQGTNRVEMLRYLLFMPTANICGMISGYTGRGGKTVLPATAMAKLDFRLVPNQQADDIFEKIKRHLQKYGFGDIQLTYRGGSKFAKTSVNSKIVRVTQRALTEVFGKPAVIQPLVPGSGPEHLFTDDLKLDLVLTRFGPAESPLHAPNEFFTRNGLIRGIKSVAKIFEYFAQE